MPFSDTVIGEAFARAGGRCECTRHHTGVTSALHQGLRCRETFQQDDANKWYVRHRVAEMAGGASTLDNAEVLCGTCYQLR